LHRIITGIVSHGLLQTKLIHYALAFEADIVQKYALGRVGRDVELEAEPGDILLFAIEHVARTVWLNQSWRWQLTAFGSRVEVFCFRPWAVEVRWCLLEALAIYGRAERTLVIVDHAIVEELTDFPVGCIKTASIDLGVYALWQDSLGCRTVAWAVNLQPHRQSASLHSKTPRERLQALWIMRIVPVCARTEQFLRNVRDVLC
jgi:hypothetical protein